MVADSECRMGNVAKRCAMKKILTLVMVLGLVAGAVAGPATAGKKKKKKAKPVATTLYLHGATVVGENDSFFNVAEGYLPMDPAKPSGETKSRQITNYVVGPNTVCAGNNLFPVWSGEVSGQIKGDVKLTFSTLGTPGKAVVRIWPDVGSSLCNSPSTGAADYPDPAGEIVVDLPPGEGTVEAVMKKVNFKALGTVIVQISPEVAADIPDPGGAVLHPFFSRVLYDSDDFASALEFKCIPSKGKTCTP